MTDTRADKREASSSNVDPTENVKALMAASLEALAKLREADKQAASQTEKYLTRIQELQEKHAAELRKSDLTTAEKTRQVDVLAAAASAAQLATAVSALQATTDRNAEILRNQVTSNAATLAKQVSDAATATQVQTDTLFRRTEERIAALERAAATGVGRQSVVDPQMDTFISEVRALAKSSAASQGKGEGVNAAWVWLIGGIGLLGTLLGITSAIVAFLK